MMRKNGSRLIKPTHARLSRIRLDPSRSSRTLLMEDFIIYGVGALAVRGARRMLFGPSKEDRLAEQVQQLRSQVAEQAQMLQQLQQGQALGINTQQNGPLSAHGADFHPPGTHASQGHGEGTVGPCRGGARSGKRGRGTHSEPRHAVKRPCYAAHRGPAPAEGDALESEAPARANPARRHLSQWPARGDEASRTTKDSSPESGEESLGAAPTSNAAHSASEASESDLEDPSSSESEEDFPAAASPAAPRHPDTSDDSSSDDSSSDDSSSDNSSSDDSSSVSGSSSDSADSSEVDSASDSSRSESEEPSCSEPEESPPARPQPPIYSEDTSGSSSSESEEPNNSESEPGPAPASCSAGTASESSATSSSESEESGSDNSSEGAAADGQPEEASAQHEQPQPCTHTGSGSGVEEETSEGPEENSKPSAGPPVADKRPDSFPHGKLSHGSTQEPCSSSEGRSPAVSQPEPGSRGEGPKDEEDEHIPNAAESNQRAASPKAEVPPSMLRAWGPAPGDNMASQQDAQPPAERHGESNEAGDHSPCAVKRSRDTTDNTPAMSKPKRRRSVFQTVTGWLFGSTATTACLAAGAPIAAAMDAPERQGQLLESAPAAEVLLPLHAGVSVAVQADEGRQQAETGGQGAHATESGFEMAVSEALSVGAAACEAAQPAKAAQPAQTTQPIATGVFAHEEFSMDDAFLTELNRIFQTDERLRAIEAPQAPSGIEEATSRRPARHGEEAEGLQDLPPPASLDNQPSHQPVHHCSAAGEEVPATTSPFPTAGTGELPSAEEHPDSPVAAMPADAPPGYAMEADIAAYHSASQSLGGQEFVPSSPELLQDAYLAEGAPISDPPPHYPPASDGACEYTLASDGLHDYTAASNGLRGAMRTDCLSPSRAARPVLGQSYLLLRQLSPSPRGYAYAGGYGHSGESGSRSRVGYGELGISPPYSWTRAPYSPLSHYSPLSPPPDSYHELPSLAGNKWRSPSSYMPQSPPTYGYSPGSPPSPRGPPSPPRCSYSPGSHPSAGHTPLRASLSPPRFGPSPRAARSPVSSPARRQMRSSLYSRSPSPRWRSPSPRARRGRSRDRAPSGSRSRGERRGRSCTPISSDGGKSPRARTASQPGASRSPSRGRSVSRSLGYGRQAWSSDDGGARYSSPLAPLSEAAHTPRSRSSSLLARACSRECPFCRKLDQEGTAEAHRSVMDACASRRGCRHLSSSRSLSPFSQERSPNRSAQPEDFNPAPEASPSPARGRRHLSSIHSRCPGSQARSLSRSAQSEGFSPLPEASPSPKRSAKSAGRSSSPSQAFGSLSAAVRRSAFGYSISSASLTCSARQEPSSERSPLHSWGSRSPSPPNGVQWSPPVSYGASPAARSPEQRSMSPVDRVQWSPGPLRTALSPSISPPPCSTGPIRSPARVPGYLHTDTEEEHSVSQEITPSVMCGQRKRPLAITSRSTPASHHSGSLRSPPGGNISSLQPQEPSHDLGTPLGSRSPTPAAQPGPSADFWKTHCSAQRMEFSRATSPPEGLGFPTDAQPLDLPQDWWPFPAEDALLAEAARSRSRSRSRMSRSLSGSHQGRSELQRSVSPLPAARSQPAVSTASPERSAAVPLQSARPGSLAWPSLSPPSRPWRRHSTILQPNHFNSAQVAEFGSMLSGRRVHPWLSAAQGPSNEDSVAVGTRELSPRRNASAAGRPAKAHATERSSPLGGSSHHRHGRRHRHSASQGSGSYSSPGHRRGGSHRGFQAQHASSPAHSHGQSGSHCGRRRRRCGWRKRALGAVMRAQRRFIGVWRPVSPSRRSQDRGGSASLAATASADAGMKGAEEGPAGAKQLAASLRAAAESPQLEAPGGRARGVLLPRSPSPLRSSYAPVSSFQPDTSRSNSLHPEEKGHDRRSSKDNMIDLTLSDG